MLTGEAWNARLKILEEPPPRVVFVFATTEPQKIAQTAAPVLSRLQRFDLKRIGPADITARLQHIPPLGNNPTPPNAPTPNAQTPQRPTPPCLTLHPPGHSFTDC